MERLDKINKVDLIQKLIGKVSSGVAVSKEEETKAKELGIDLNLIKEAFTDEQQED